MARPSYYKKLDITFYVLLIALLVIATGALIIWAEVPDYEQVAKNVGIISFGLFVALLVILLILALTTKYNFTYTLFHGKKENQPTEKPAVTKQAATRPAATKKH